MDKRERKDAVNTLLDWKTYVDISCLVYYNRITCWVISTKGKYFEDTVQISES